ncbi:response regulator with CheY-like receiver domain and winged-helix DNA-binding domain [Terriglobus roseus DSM 18391]|uniref:Response regulator with CheY-like receiver domain and winged-helix DNA-binding domain n=1 Tax=Terriglobus roseus (strain DSM 18391 / NRRL B-41598 / KBS 63) TaxID=926566 RepID=I3ZI24_TERRK|nr:response regulator transcription factor [Terriglobus roseus]AFL88554.1 response regulator with CheY-like receiver domain and winged-helix DNA-binding domain [Terriglobus roseus DSM 18391]AFL88892.1 response regulator with CheY-like receiver domain and winged-helix DNA-binding domain [Terriglobus roseus DSM 18391]
MSDQPLIALVEDEEHLADALLFNLKAEGYRVHHEADGEAALAWLLNAPERPRAVLLDVMLPGMDGFAIARALRAANNYVPILMLTARDRPEDVLEGFESGADDYLNKPFDLSILLARLNSLLRRMQWQQESAPTTEAPAAAEPEEVRDVYEFEGKTINFDSLEIHANGKITRLTLMEADLLRYLLVREGRVVSRKEILEEVWRVREDTDTRAIDNFIVRLRRYLEDDPVRPQHLLTVRGVGYRFVIDGAKAAV